MTAASRPHDHAIAVGSDQIDFMGHVNNAHYLSWVQEAVLSHWRHIAPPDAVAAHLWVALKHEITYRRPAFLDDQVIAEMMADPDRHIIEVEITISGRLRRRTGGNGRTDAGFR